MLVERWKGLGTASSNRAVLEGARGFCTAAGAGQDKTDCRRRADVCRCSELRGSSRPAHPEAAPPGIVLPEAPAFPAKTGG